MANYDFKAFNRLGPQVDPYARPNTRVEYQLFSNDYFTGADVSLYLGDIWVDEIVDFQFSMREQIMPVYGYSSYTPDALIRGNRIIQGSFTVNFKSVGYILEVLKHKDPIKSIMQEKKLNQNLPNIRRTSHYTLDEVLKMYGVTSFKEMANEYENKLWGAADGTDETLNQDRGYFVSDDDGDGFEIKIAYGPVESVYHLQDSYKNGKLAAPNHTIESLIGVQIVGVSKVMSAGSQGVPLTETYEFVAKDLNAKVSLG